MSGMNESLQTSIPLLRMTCDPYIYLTNIIQHPPSSTSLASGIVIYRLKQPPPPFPCPPRPQPNEPLRTKHTPTSSLLLLRLALHLLAHLDIDLEELGDTAVETHGFAFVQVWLAVGCVDAFFGAGCYEAVLKEYSLALCHWMVGRWCRGREDGR
jgi:hypothetical protein